MSKRFVVATNGSSVENRDKITKFFDAKTWGYWHWFNELWVLWEFRTLTPQNRCGKSCQMQQD